jgi:hypothetical protein
MIRLTQLAIACCVLTAACEGSSPVTQTETVHLSVTSTTCKVQVRWAINGTETEQEVSPPWSLDVRAVSGDVVGLRACDACATVCTLPRCDMTINATTVWRGVEIMNHTTSGETGNGLCAPGDPNRFAVTLP